MKKLFAVLAVVCFAVAANATVLWSETFGNNAKVTKVDLGDGKTAWPYLNQTDYFSMDHFDDYDSIGSFSCSVRSKKWEGEDSYTVGMYFANGKEKCFAFLGTDDKFVTVEEGARLVFEAGYTETTDALDLSLLTVKVNGSAVTVPATTLANKKKATIDIEIEKGDVSSIELNCPNLKSQLFVTGLRIVDAAEPMGIFNTVKAEKAQKVIENGQVVIIRNGVRYNAVGAKL